MSRVIIPAFISDEELSFARISRRRATKRSRSPARRVAVWTYSSRVAATRSAQPIRVKRLAPTRPACARPSSVTTGNAHPECFAGGRGAVVGKRIEADVHLTIDRDVLDGCGGVGGEFDARGVDATLRKGTQQPFARFVVGQRPSLEQQVGPRNRSKDIRPQVQHAVAQLREVVERPERHETTRQRRRRVGNAGIGIRLKTQESVRKAPQLFHVVPVGDGFRIRNAIRQPPVDRGKSRGAWISAVGHLNGRRAPRETEQSVSRRVPGQINQHVYPIFDDALGQCLVGQGSNIPPDVRPRLGLNPGRHRVGHRVRIAMDLDRVSIVRPR